MTTQANVQANQTHDEISTVAIQINGKWHQVSPQITVAAAIMQTQSPITRRSVTGQMRFAVCGMGVCQECRVTINHIPCQLACQALCQEGMHIETASL